MRTHIKRESLSVWKPTDKFTRLSKIEIGINWKKCKLPKNSLFYLFMFGYLPYKHTHETIFNAIYVTVTLTEIT